MESIQPQGQSTEVKSLDYTNTFLLLEACTKTHKYMDMDYRLSITSNLKQFIYTKHGGKLSVFSAHQQQRSLPRLIQEGQSKFEF